jgi:hypothetical protein
LEVPDTADRYYCLQMFDACLQTVAYLGRRTTGTGAARFLLTGPGWHGDVPDGMTQVAFPTNFVYVMSRMEVRDGGPPDEVALASALMQQFVLGALADFPAGRRGGIAEDDATGGRFPTIELAKMGASYFDCLCAILAVQPPPQDEADEWDRFKKVGIAPGATPSADADLAPLLESALQRALAEVRAVQPMTTLGQGPWMTSTAVRDVGSLDPTLRARMNIDAPGFQAAVEAVYTALLTDAEGSGFDGSHSYALHFAPDGIPPVEAFWSMTMYALPGMRLVENPIGRHAIGTNLAGLIHRPDGSLDLLLQPDRPDDDGANWLPTAPGPFMLLCRLYQPTEDVIEGRYSMPPATRLGSVDK